MLIFIAFLNDNRAANVNCIALNAFSTCHFPIFHILDNLVNTDSLLSDILKSSSISSSKSNAIKEVCLIIDLTETQENYEHRKMAYEQVKLACQSVAANLHLLQFGKLDFVSY